MAVSHQTGTARSGDITLHYRRLGRPGCTPLVFVHGLSFFSWDWLEFAQVLAIDREAACLDMRGFSDSSRAADYSGFEYATRGGMTIAVADISVPAEKGELLGKADDQVKEIDRQFQRGLITDDERYEAVVDVWQKTSKDLSDTMMRQLDPANRTRYVYDGQARDMVRKSLTVQVMQSNGTTAPVTRTYYASSHGPIVVIPGQLAWDRTLAYAIRDANLENWRLIEYFHRANKAQNLAEYKAAVEGTVGNPWTNSIAVDRAGNTYYASVTPTPHVNAAKEAACIPAPFKPLIASGLFVLAGSTSQCEWTIDPAAPQPGIFAARDLPTLSTRKDFVHNANDSAWLSNPAAPN